MVVALPSFILLIIVLSGFQTLQPDDQVVVETASGEREVVNGPGLKFIDPFQKSEFRKATLLGPLQYALIEAKLSGVPRVEAGPQLLQLGPYDELVSVSQKFVLKEDEYVRLVDKETGGIHVERGSKNVIPGPTEKSLEGVQKAVSLSRYESVRVVNELSGEMRTEVGEKLVFPGPFEKMDAKQSGIRLSQNEWIRIRDKATGEVKVERGEKIIFLNSTESVVGNRGTAIEVNRQQAVLTLSKVTGQQHLITEAGMFIPGPYEEIIEVQQLVIVEPHEAVAVRDDHGAFTFHIGSDGQGQGTSFFLPPYNKLMTMQWSCGTTGLEKKNVTKMDLRAQYQTFNYEVRTSDNVRLRLEGTIFWRVTNVAKMVRATSDPVGDIWHRARSTLIQAVSQSSLSVFMKDFNTIVKSAFESETANTFYVDRGVEVQSMEVTRFECVDKKTAEVLQEIIQETTNRINRLQAQESENDVSAAKLTSDIMLEKQKTELIRTRAENAKLEARVQGESAGLSLAKGAATFLGPALSEVVPDLEDRLALYKLHQELASKNKDTASLASGQATLFLTPQDMNLKLQMQHQQSQPPRALRGVQL